MKRQANTSDWRDAESQGGKQLSIHFEAQDTYRKTRRAIYIEGAHYPYRSVIGAGRFEQGSIFVEEPSHLIHPASHPRMVNFLAWVIIVIQTRSFGVGLAVLEARRPLGH